MTDLPLRPSRSPPEGNKPKLSRTSTQKVRTGCITCKKRHIKCDEKKPSCGNCLKNRRRCEGYIEQQSKTKSPPGVIQFRLDSKQATRASPSLSQIRISQDPLDVRDAKSVLYFHEFINLVQGPWFSTGSNGDLWTATLPQLAHSNSTIRHAAIAIGALSKWLTYSNHDTLRDASVPVQPVTEGDTHYFRAVSHYCHSLKLQSQQQSMQDAVFLSVLFLCFETLRGHSKAALDHVNHGLAVLLALLTDRDSTRHINALAPNPKPLIATVGDIFTQLITQARFVLRGSLSTSPPLPHFTKGLRDKKHTFESFMTLISQLPRGPATKGNIPTLFNSLDEFELYLIIARRIRPEVGIISIDIVQKSGILYSSDPFIITAFWRALTSDPRIQKVCDELSAEMRALDAAYLPLFNQIIMSNQDSPTYLRAIHLRLQFLDIYTFENPTHYHDLNILQTQTPLFREYLSLANIALRIARQDLKNPAQRLSLQCGLSWHLLLVVFFCRDPLLRDEAIWMLKSYPGQDGLWNAQSMYVLALRTRELERTNSVEGTPAEQWERLWRREYLFEEGGERVVFCFLDKNETTGEWEVVEEVAEVRGDLDNVPWKRRPLTSSGRLLISDIIVL
ncbi:hypothetical protein NW759_009645 [Fusarium solani]|uniref:Zn(2)-C6 fungal-type domain-containing protein n=1 Tax=Fusarium solani TaxID=169388 RepID=A0A9P9HBF1_FUSSL|nr:uncharacterized protein B0J15DRAFT_423810 [Fusarium solani]KAH7254478.1 hypothetical protein B0J15DRAFT_423810 [Fusarium solani]KAJ4215785.1 hypothetical protein NW759_009645 [Fusarium solani]